MGHMKAIHMTLAIALFFAHCAQAWDGDQAVAAANAMANYQWTCSSANTTIPSTCGAVNWVCDWTIGQQVVGIAYKWGGYDDILQFAEKLSLGKAVGSHKYHSPAPNYPGLGCVTGVDCSGLVSRAWSLASHYGTTQLGDVSVLIALAEDMLGGDIWLDPGEHVLLQAAPPNENRFVSYYESSGGENKVVYHGFDDQVTIATLDVNYIPRRNALWAGPGRISRACRDENGYCEWTVTNEDGVTAFCVLASADGLSWNQYGDAISATGQLTYAGIPGPPGSVKVALRINDGAQECEAMRLASCDEARKDVRACGGSSDIRQGGLGGVMTGAELDGGILVIAPHQLATACDALVAYWDDELGYDVERLTLGPLWTAAYREATSTGYYLNTLKSQIASSYSRGVRYVLLVGDYSNWRESPEYGADQSRDVLPTFVRAHPIVWDHYSTDIHDYYFTDAPYADVLGDDLRPDIVVTRWPAATASEVEALVQQAIAYDGAPVSGGGGTVIGLTGDNSLSTRGVYIVRQHARELKQAFSAMAPVRWLGMSECWDYGMAPAAAVALICNQERPEALVGVGVHGNTYFAAGALNAEALWRMNSTSAPIVVMSGCSTADYASAETQGRPVCELALAEGKAAMWIGTTQRSLQTGNQLLLRAMAGRWLEVGDVPFAEVMRRAQCDVLAAWQSDPQLEATVLEYQVLGSPVTFMRQQNAGIVAEVSGISPAFVRAYPNPSNGNVVLQWDGMNAVHKVTIYDVRGRLVRRIDVREGDERTEWDMKKDDGGGVGSGLYLVRVFDASERIVQAKVVVTK